MGEPRLIETLERQLVSLSAGAHVCPIYTTAAERANALVPFFRGGLARGEQCLYIADAEGVEELLNALRADGIEIEAVIERGALIALTERSLYARNGHFDPDAMFTLLQTTAEHALASDFTGLSVAGEMTWLLGPDPGNSRFLECEARINDLPPQLGTRTVCQYDRRRFPPAILRDVLRLHPLVVVGEHVHDNIYFDPAALSSKRGLDGFVQVDWMLNQLQARSRRDGAVAQLGRSSLSGARPADLMIVAVDLIAAELTVDFADVFELLPGGDAFRLLASAGWRHSAPGAVVHTQPDGPVAAGALTANAPFIIHDWRNEIRFRQPAVLKSEGIVSSLHIPIMTGTSDGLFGVLGVHSSTPRLFSEEEVAFLNGVATVLAQVMRASRGEEAFRAVIDGTADLVAGFDQALRYIYVNPAIESLLGIPSEALIGEELRHTPVPEPLLRSWEISIPRVWRTGREQATAIKAVTPEGERTFHSRIAPGFGPDGSVQFVLAISRDISEQHAAELERAQLYREVVAQQQQLTEMVAGVMKERERHLSGIDSVMQIQRLTRRDRDILRLIARGWTNREIAAELGRSPGTVRNQVARILVKLDASDRTQAAVRASELGLIGAFTE